MSVILKTSRTLFQAFEIAGIRVCHWKSNEHLLEGLTGITDLDILVDENDEVQVRDILSRHRFRRFESISPYPYIEDYIGVDFETGIMIHVHLHFRLIAGEKHLKGYRLPWEDKVLSTRVMDPDLGVYRSDPESELILLLVRMVLKIRLRDYLFELAGRRFLSGGALSEYHWLLERIDTDRFETRAKKLLDEKSSVALNEFIKQREKTIFQLKRLSKVFKPSISKHRLYSPFRAYLLKIAGELKWLYGGIVRRYLSYNKPKRRIDPEGGLVIAFIGADGSGKSTVVEEVRGWLSWKVDTVPVYFGSGDGNSSLLRRPMKFILDLISRSPKKSTSAGTRKKVPSGIKKWAIIPWSAALAREKKKKLKRVSKMKEQGIIVISDRYPQNTIKGFSDGPLLDHTGGIKGKIAQWEEGVYQMVAEHPPDLLIKLDVSPETALSRKPIDNTPEEIHQRIEAVKKIHYHGVDEKVIDANRDLDQVLLDVKQVVWSKVIDR